MVRRDRPVDRLLHACDLFFGAFRRAVDDVLAALGVNGLAAVGKAAPETGGSGNFSDGVLDSDAEMLLNALGFEPAGLDRLVQRTGLAAHSVISKLQLLELAGRVESLPGGRYGRTAARQAR